MTVCLCLSFMASLCITDRPLTVRSFYHTDWKTDPDTHTWNPGKQTMTDYWMSLTHTHKHQVFSCVPRSASALAGSRLASPSRVLQTQSRNVLVLTPLWLSDQSFMWREPVRARLQRVRKWKWISRSSNANCQTFGGIKKCIDLCEWVEDMFYFRVVLHIFHICFQVMRDSGFRSIKKTFFPHETWPTAEDMTLAVNKRNKICTSNRFSGQ